MVAAALAVEEVVDACLTGEYLVNAAWRLGVAQTPVAAQKYVVAMTLVVQTGAVVTQTFGVVANLAAAAWMGDVAWMAVAALVIDAWNLGAVEDEPAALDDAEVTQNAKVTSADLMHGETLTVETCTVAGLGSAGAYVEVHSAETWHMVTYVAVRNTNWCPAGADVEGVAADAWPALAWTEVAEAVNAQIAAAMVAAELIAAKCAVKLEKAQLAAASATLHHLDKLDFRHEFLCGQPILLCK